MKKKKVPSDFDSTEDIVEVTYEPPYTDVVIRRTDRWHALPCECALGEVRLSLLHVKFLIKQLPKLLPLLERSESAAATKRVGNKKKASKKRS